MTNFRAGVSALTAALLMLISGSALAVVSQKVLTGTQSASEGGCLNPVPLFSGLDCSYNGTNPTFLGFNGYVGPGRSAVFYFDDAPYTRPGGMVGDLAPEFDPLKDEIPLFTGSVIDVEDAGTPADCSDDTIAGTIVFSAGQKWIDGGQGNSVEETWSDGDLSYSWAANGVDNGAALNGDGGCDYVIASKGFPEPLVEAPGGMDRSFPIDVITSDDDPMVDPLFWAAASPLAMSSSEDTQGGAMPVDGNAGIPTAAVVVGASYACQDNQVGTTCSDNGATHFNGSFSQLENLLLEIRTNAAGNITQGRIWQKNESNILITMPQPNSWVASLLTFTGACSTNCPAVVDAVDDSFDVLQDAASAPLAVGANDTNFADPVTAAITVPPSMGGTATVNASSPGPSANITIDYAPAAGFSGTETFTYQITDANTDSDTGVVTVNVLAVGANDDAASTRLNTAITITVGANDVGFTDPATAAITVNPDMGGTASTNATSPGPHQAITIDYIPVAALGTPTYTETFTYSVTDSTAPMPIVDTAVVTVTVNNQVPAAVAAAATAPEGGSAATDVAGLAGANLGDAPSVVAVTAAPTNGTTAVAGTTITYTANAFFVGNDSYDYTITDDDGETSTATVSVTVGPALVPVASDDAAMVDQDDSVDIDVTANDTAGSGALANHTVTVTTAPASGSTSVAANNVVTYTPDAGFNGTDSFVYTLEDEDGSDTDTATVTIDVDASGIIVRLPGGNSAVDPWSLALLLFGVPILRRRR